MGKWVIHAQIATRFLDLSVEIFVHFSQKTCNCTLLEPQLPVCTEIFGKTEGVYQARKLLKNRLLTLSGNKTGKKQPHV
jgi:hypothetical protein